MKSSRDLTTPVKVRVTNSYRIVVVVLVLALPHVAQSPPQLRPNDPGYDDFVGAQISYAQAYWEVVNHWESKISSDVVVMVIDIGADCTETDLKRNCLEQKDFSGQGFINGSHGTSVASIIAAETNNNLGVASESMTNRVKFITANVFNSQTFSIPSIEQALQYAIDQRAKGVNIVAINISLAGQADRDATVAQLLQKVHQSGIYVFVGASEHFDGTSGVNLDTAPFTWWADYAREPNSNVIAVTNWDGSQIQKAADWGPNTVALTAPGVGIPVVFHGGVANFGGTSAAAPLAAATYALIRATVEPDADKAADRLKASAIMEGSLLGKVGFGRIDTYRALTMNFDQPSSGFVLLNQQGSPRAVALDSVTLRAGDFPRVNTNNFSTDQKTRLALFSPAQLTASSLSITGTDLIGNSLTFPVENVVPLQVTDQVRLSEIVMRLPDNISAGDYWISFTYQGTRSNKVLLTVKP